MEAEKINNVLKSIGLSKNEIKVYLDLIRFNPSSALDISKKTGIHRPNTYDALRSLIEKGFVKETVKEKKKIFRAMNPKRIRDYVLQKKQDIDSIIPDLIEFSKNNDEKQNVSISKGIFAFRTALLGLLEINKPINVYGIQKEVTEILGEGFLKDFHKQRIEKKILMRHIYNIEAVDRIKELNNMGYTEAKHLARKYDAHAITNICGDTVVIVICYEPILIIEIKSKDIAEAYNNYFEILWRQARVS